MKKACCALVFTLVLAAALPVSAAAQAMAGEEEDLSQGTEGPQTYVPGGWPSFLAAASNIVYVPLRFAITIVTAEAGGLTGWLTGGDQAAAQAVWHSTDGQAYIRPEVIDGHERLRFGSYE
jgi:hypothetical protein